MHDPGDRLFYRGDVKGLQLRLYRPGDEARVDARADFARDFRADDGLPDGPKWTLLDGDRVLAVGGFEFGGADVWDGWAYAAALRPREWLFAAWCAVVCMNWIRSAKGGRIRAVGYGARATRLLRRMGLDATNPEFPHFFAEAA